MRTMQQWPDGTHVAEIAAFVAVAERGSFSKAADSLGRDATVVSRRVQALERRLGVRLLERTTRRVAVTEAGSAFLARAHSIAEALAEAEEETSSFARGEPRGTLRLSLPASFGRMWVAPYLPEFLAQHPLIRIDARFSNRFVDLVAEGFDAAIRLGTLADSRLVARKIGNRKRLLCAAPTFLSRYGAPARPDDLADMPCLVFTGFASHPQWFFKGRNNELVSVRPYGPMTSDDAEALVAAAVSGAGLMLTTDWLVGRELAERKLMPVLPEWNVDDEGAIYTVMPSNRLLANKTRAFVDWISTRFDPEPPWSNWSASSPD